MKSRFYYRRTKVNLFCLVKEWLRKRTQKEEDPQGKQSC